MELPQEGKYLCKLNDQIVIYEAKTGSLCAALPCVIVDTGFTFKHTCVLAKADGTILTKTNDTLKAVFGWDGPDPFWLMDHSADGGALRTVEFEIVGGPETGDRGGQYFKSQWLNPVGGGMKTPPAADRRSVLAKYGSKFAALAAAGQSREQKAESRNRGDRQQETGHQLSTLNHQPPLPPPPPYQLSTIHYQPPLPSTMEDAWAALNQTQTGKPAGVIEKLWFDTISRLFPNQSNSDLKPHEWGRLKAEFADAIPM